MPNQKASLFLNFLIPFFSTVLQRLPRRRRDTPYLDRRGRLLKDDLLRRPKAVLAAVPGQHGGGSAPLQPSNK